MKITIDMLIQAKACKLQVGSYPLTFPAGKVELTEELCIKHSQDFDWSRAADSLLTTELNGEFTRLNTLLLAEYNRLRGVLRAGHVRRVNRSKETTTIFSDYQSEVAVLWAAHNKSIDSLIAEYSKLCASIFFVLSST